MFKNLNLEGFILSKTKKIISMLLAVVMTLSMAPTSVFAAFNISVDGSDQTAETVSSAGYVKSEGSPVSYDIDTVGTTEVVRVAANASNSCEYGTAIVPEATPSGMPKITSGTFPNVAYAGETPQQAVIKINFKNGAKPDEAPSLLTSLGTNMSYENADKTTVGTTTTYTWKITGGTASAGTNVLCTISYKIAGIDYVSYASIHIENILRPNGVISVGYRRKGTPGFYTYSRVSALLLFQGKNVYSGWAGTGGESRGYIDYGSGNALDGGAISGCGSSGLKSKTDGGYAIADDANGTVRYFGGERTKDANTYFGYGYDKNRPLSNVYLDAAEGETVDSLNIRATYQNGESSDCNYAFLTGLGVWQATENPGGLKKDGGFSSYPTGDTVLKVVTPIPGCDAGQNGDGTYFVPQNVTATDDSNHKVIHFTGSGNSANVYTIGISSRGQLDKESQENRWTQVNAAVVSFKFNRYDSTALRTLLNAVRLNTGVSYNGVTYKNGQYPQARYYTAGWDAFNTAYQNALYAISAPDIALPGTYSSKQAEIDGVKAALEQAYAGLQGYRSSVNYTVNYTNTDSNVALLPSRSGTIGVGETLKTAAPTVKGYVCQEAVQNTTNFIDGTTDITITYTYLPAEQQIIIFTNNDNEDMPNIGCKYGYTLPINEMNANLGTKAYYTFDGWYYDDGFQNPVGANDKMPASALSVFAKWVPTPLKITLDTKISGKDPYQIGSVTPDPENEVTFARPADPSIEGYVFVNFYEDSALETLVEWPLVFNLGDSDKTIYGRFEDVNGKISFESMGGSKVNTINYTANTPISQPAAPTREGYDFAGWFFDREYTTPVNGWTTASYSGGAIVASAPIAGGTHTRNTMTGFVAYARWTPQVHKISFETGINYDAEPSKFNTRNRNLTSISGLTDTAISQEDLDSVVIPTRFGYEFANWSYQGARYDLKKYPTKDITLTAEWRPVDYSAFIDILAYKMLDGAAVSVNENDYGDDPELLPVEDKPEVMKGDIITFRMSSKTNFYTGSSLFVFMYDKNFYELVGSGTSVFKLNPENDYIKGLGVLDAATPTFTAVTDSSLLRWPEGLDQNTYAAMQIAIDPNVTAENYDTEPMEDESWILEFKLKIKDDATGSGTVLMDNAWTRNPENPMGTMFYGWTSSKDSVMNTTNNVVTPDLKYTHSVVTVGDETPVMRTVNISSVNGDLAGKFSDDSTSKSYTGRASTEILDYIGSPALYGYHLDEGEEFVDGNGNFWIEGYYPKEEQNETMSYVANWKVNTWTAKFYATKGDTSPTSLKATLSTTYNQLITGVPNLPAKKGYSFGGWLDENDNDVDFSSYLAPNNDVIFNAKWVPSVNKYTIKYMFGDTEVKSVTVNGKEGEGPYTEDTVMIVNEIPEVPAAKTFYVLASDLDPGVNGYGYDDTGANVLPISGVVGTDGVTLTVQCKKTPLNETFNSGASGVLFESTGDVRRTYSGLEGSTYAENGITAENIEKPVRLGYTFGGYTTGSGSSLIEWSPDVTFTGTHTWRAVWILNTYRVVFKSDDGSATYKDTEVSFNANITAPAAPTKDGYTFKGWKLAGEDDSTATTSLGKLDTEGDREYRAVFAINQYNVSYTLGGAAYEGGGKYDFGSTQNYIAAPEAPTGYEFDGWYFPGDDTTKHTASETYTVPGNDIIITGKIVAKEYDVKFDANGGKFGTETFVNVPSKFDGAISTPETNPEKSGYSFEGWKLEGADDSTASMSLGTLTTEGATYYAVWSASLTKYYVDIYKMLVNGTYSETPDSTVELEGTVDTTCDTYVPADADTGFTLDNTNCVLSGKIPAPDAGELRLVVKYKRNQHKVYTKNGPDATSVEAATYYYGAAVSDPAAPDASVKPGYTFNGWSWSGSHETMPDDDLTATATWIVNKYPVKFYLTQEDYNNSKAPVNEAQYEYQSVIHAASTTREGYEFKGWAREGSTEIVTFDENLKVAIDGDTFVGIWKIKQYKIIYRSNGVDVRTDEVDYGTPKANFPAPPTPAPRAGYEFKGWNTDNLPETMPANDSGIIVNAKWERKTYTINIDTDGGTPTWEAIKEPAGTDISGLIPQSAPTKEGYYSAGWYIGEELYTFPETMPDELPGGVNEITVKAKWNIESYTIKYVGFNGADLGSITKNYGEAIAAPEAPDVEGYKFVSWSETTPETMPDLGINGAEKTITANYAKEQYTIEIDAGDGKFADGFSKKYITKYYGEAITAPDEPTREGYTFDGWSETIPTTMPDLGDDDDGVDKTITAKWKINSYTIKYKGFNGADLGSITKEYGAEIKAADIPEAPEVEGYKFVSWSEATPKTMPALTEDKVITANYEKETFTIYIDADGGIFADDLSSMKTITKEFGEAIFAPEKPSKEGHTFKAWSEEIPATMPDLGADGAEKTITALWDVNSYKIYFDANNGEFSEGVTKAESTFVFGAETAAYETKPTRTGYTFKHWYETDEKVEYEFGTMPAKAVNLKAYWTIDQHTISFDSDGGSEVAPITAEYGAIISAPAAPTKEGYTFKYWYEGTDSTKQYNFVTMPANDVSLKAFYDVNAYSVKFYDADGIVISDANYDFGTLASAIVLPEAPEKTYYSFEGWTLKEDGSDDIADAFDFENVEAKVGKDGYNFYPIFVKIPVELIKTEESATVVVNKTYPARGIIYGLETKLTEEKLIEEYISFTGSGEIVVTPSLKGNNFSVCGTGTVVDLFDSETGNIVASYYLVIFGDINGDGISTSVDVSLAKAEAAREEKTWSAADSALNFKLKAIDTDNDGVISANEISTLSKVALAKYDYVQTDGTTVDHKKVS